MEEIVIDGSNKILGREASLIAKKLLSNNKVIVINAEQMVISGHRADILAKYKQKVELKDKANPEHSPYWSRRPDLFVKRVIRGMLPYKRPKGKAAFDNLRVYVGRPEAFKNSKVYDTKAKDTKKIFENVITIKELTGLLGYQRE
jgi:large subunit ribosomal protein L13